MWTRTWLLLMMIAGAACNSVIDERSFPSYADAQRQGATGDGTVPGCVAPEAVAIVTAFEVETNERWTRFSVGPTNIDRYTGQLDPPDPAVLGGYVRTPNRGWWPSELVGRLDRERVHAAGYRLYSSPRERNQGPAFVAVRGTDVFCWCP